MAEGQGEGASLALMDLLLQHQIYLERYKKGQLRELQRFLSQLTDDVSGLLGQRLGDVTVGSVSVRTARLEGLMKQLGQVSDQTSAAMMNYTKGQLKDLAAYESGVLVGSARQVLPVQVSFEAVAPVQLWAAVNSRPFEGRILETWVQDYSTTQRRRLQEAVRMSVVEGETVDQAIRRVRGTQKLKGQDGVIPGITKRTAEALVRTAINHTVTEARQETLVQNQQVVKGAQWRSTLDGSTSLICIARDGKVYALDAGPRPPGHPNCRSTIVPVFKSWRELGIDLDEAEPGTRASMNGQVPEAETYPSWLKRQPADFQNDVLGNERARLFRSGRLTVDKFVDDSGHIYSLGQLRARHPVAF